MQTDGKFILTDLGCAAAIMVAGHDLESINRIDDSNRMEFVFPDSEEVRKVANCYLSGNHIVNARSYSETLKVLKTRIYMLKEEN